MKKENKIIVTREKRVRYIGIKKAADELGTDYNYLRRALNGEVKMAAHRLKRIVVKDI